MPQNLVLCAANAIDNALLTANPATVASMPVGYLQLPARGRVVKTVGTTSQEFSFTWGGQGFYMNFLALMRHNLEAGATWRVQLFSDSEWTTQIYDSRVGGIDVAAFQYDTLGELDWGFEELGAGMFSGYKTTQFSDIFFNRVLVLSGRVTIYNPGNSNGYLAASRLFAGDGVELQWNPDKSDWGWQEGTTQTRSPGAGLRSNAEEPYRALDLSIAFTDPLQRDRLADMLHFAGLRKDIYINLFPANDGTLRRDYTFLGKFVGKLPKISHAAGTNLLKSQLQFEEA